MKTKGSRGSTARAAGALAAAQAGDFSRPILVENVPETGLQVTIEADSAEREAVALTNGLVAVGELKASLEITRLERGVFKVSGSLTADVTQTCVVSLDPFSARICADIDVDFAASAPAGSAEEAEDQPDPIIEGRIDLGALAEEFLTLSLDPYPRKPGVRFDDSVFAAKAAEPASPFEALKKLKAQE